MKDTTIARFTGLEALRADLRALPDALQAGAERELTDAARTTHAEILGVYNLHRITGGLAEGLALRQDPDTKGRVGTRVVSNASYAYIFEFGSSRSRAFPTLVPIARDNRQTAYRAIVAMVQSHGLTVRGDTT